jgi:hypothetical protein
MSVAQRPVIDDVCALRARALDEGRRDRRRRQPHVSRHTNAARLEIGHEAPPDLAGRVLVDFARVQAPYVICLENVWRDLHVLCPEL